MLHLLSILLAMLSLSKFFIGNLSAVFIDNLLDLHHVFISNLSSFIFIKLLLNFRFLLLLDNVMSFIFIVVQLSDSLLSLSLLLLDGNVLFVFMAMQQGTCFLLLDLYWCMPSIQIKLVQIL